MIEPTGGWTEDLGDTWTLTIPGKPGRPDLLLRVFPDPTHTSEPWTWEVVALEDDAEREVEVGGAISREAAMAVAVARATAYELE
ncbi:hypothetical protein [Roseomonas chloroacetimidivorans]|uniref:hypothetical protein n=1 Tax=Roseomonas chloroacetimidivorans TaxID=1766656 RepID=UPI003C75A8DB